jgi:ESS family glutamate:Na+ symporter
LEIALTHGLLLYEPFLGGGLLTALSVPLIARFGLPAFTVTSLC